MKTEWTWDEALEDGTDLANEILETTRWGTLQRRVFEFEGTTYAVSYVCVPEHGVEDDSPPEVYEVRAKEVTVTKWEKVTALDKAIEHGRGYPGKPPTQMDRF